MSVAGAAFHLEGVGLQVGTTVILSGIDLELAGSGITTLLGASGSGKSSLLRLLNRLSVPTSGSIRYGGADLDTLDPRSLRRRVTMLFQQPTLLGDDVLSDLRVADPSLSETDAAELCERVQLDPALLHRETGALSGGEAQRLCTARGLATNPEMILADEPTSALDHRHADGLESLLRTLADDGLGVIWVTHDRAQARRLADHVAVLDGGCLLAAGRPETLDASDDERVRSAWGGR